MFCCFVCFLQLNSLHYTGNELGENAGRFRMESGEIGVQPSMLQVASIEGLKWLFLPKHKLELMFSSIEPCAPRGCTFPVTCFPLFVPQTRTRIPAMSYQPMKS